MKKMKKFISVMLALSMLLAFPIVNGNFAAYAASDNASVVVSDSNNSPIASGSTIFTGDTIKVSVTVPGVSDRVGNMGFKVHFDKNLLTITKAEYPNINDELYQVTYLEDAVNSSLFGINRAAANAFNMADDLQFNATFTVNNEASLGEYEKAIWVEDAEYIVKNNNKEDIRKPFVNNTAPLFAFTLADKISGAQAITVAAPEIKGTPATTSGVTLAGGANYTVQSITWAPTVESTFLANTDYKATVVLKANDNYEFDSAATVTCENAKNIESSTVSNDKSTLIGVLVFENTGAKKLSAISVSGTPTKTAYKYGETFEAAGLTVTATYNDDSTDAAFTDYDVVYEDNAANYFKMGQTKVTLKVKDSVSATSDATKTAEVTDLTVAKADVKAYAVPATYNVPLNSKLSEFTKVAPAKATGVLDEELAGSVRWYKDGGYTETAAESDVSSLTEDAKITLYWDFALDDAAKANYNNQLAGTSTGNIRGSVEFTIVNGDPVVVTFADESKTATYGDANFTNAASVVSEAGGTATGQDISYASGNTDVATVNAATGEVTIVGAGSAAITATAAADPGKWREGSASYTLTVSPKKLSVADGTVKVTKEYNGNTSAENTLSGALALTGIVGSDEVSVNMANVTVGAYPSADYGTYTVTLSGIALTGGKANNYTVDATYQFTKATITKTKQQALTISPTENVTYGGDDFEITVGGGSGTGAVTLTSSDNSVLSLTKKAGSDNVFTAKIGNAGTVTLSANKAEDANYAEADEVTAELTVDPKAIAEEDFTIDTEDKVFTGSAIQPAVSSTTLRAGTDYKVEYSDNTNVGDAAKITITGQNNYSGTVEKTFKITPKAFSEENGIAVDSIQDYTYNGKDIAPLVNVTDGSTVLKAGTDYDVTFTDNKSAGTAKLTITAKGNYDGAIEKSFTIKPAALSGSVSITTSTDEIATDTVLTAVMSGLNAYEDEGTTLVYRWSTASEDGSETYTVTAEDAGKKISVRVTSSGNYEGSVESAAVEVGKTQLKGSVTLTGETTVGSELSATVEVTSTDATEDDYTVVWTRDGEEITNPSEDATKYTVTKEDLGHAISVKVVSKGDTFTGEIAGESKKIAATAPSFGEAPAVKAGSRKLTVTLNADANGAEITNYKVNVTDADGNITTYTLAGNETSYTISDLENGTTYTITVTAVNSEGETTSSEVKATPKSSGGPAGGAGGTGAGTGKTVVDVDGSGSENSADNGENKGDAKTSADFEDIPEGYWAESAIDYVLEKGYFKGTSDTTFNPGGNATREQVMTVLARFAGNDDATIEEGVAWAVANGVSDGSNRKDMITREQFVTMLWRLCGEPDFEGEVTEFDDADSIDSWAENAMAWAIANGVIQGYGDGSVRPLAEITRAQMATVMQRIDEKGIEAAETTSVADAAAASDEAATAETTETEASDEAAAAETADAASESAEAATAESGEAAAEEK